MEYKLFGQQKLNTKYEVLETKSKLIWAKDVTMVLKMNVLSDNTDKIKLNLINQQYLVSDYKIKIFKIQELSFYPD
mgnify:FL=1